ncbi:hypothetical protein DPMN_078016 [Dreissena polymorpha]|uniref:Uncharacterized protein n=2 Tax=Dreissena polymorpha TaxID=45954 RepID=A0A9D3YRQ0_DREPO|nr:hypothetical protein DPMN_078016 [Dreissena polymorpha]
MFFSLKHGERLGYSVFLLNKLLEEEGEHGKLYLMYDIACSLHQHLKKNQQNAVLERTRFAIPMF